MPQVVYVLMEVRQETDYVLHHAQKILAIFAAMRDLARQLRAAGHRVRYVAIDDASNRQSMTRQPGARWPRTTAPSTLQWQQPDEWRLDAQLQAWASTTPLPARAWTANISSTARDDLATQMHRPPPMADGAFLPHHAPPLPACCWTPTASPWADSGILTRTTASPGPAPRPNLTDWRPTTTTAPCGRRCSAPAWPSFGDPQADALRWPLNRAEALACLEAFIAHALPHFGDYEDAMASQAPRLFHSLLSFALNVKMLHPLEVLQRAEAAYRAGPRPAGRGGRLCAPDPGLARVRARHLLGAHAGLRAAQCPGPPPAAAATGSGLADTHMRCLQLSIGQSLQHAHAHHIQRLMVIGNFALLAGLDPRRCTAGTWASTSTRSNGWSCPTPWA